MKIYTETELMKMDDDQLLELAIDQMGLGALSEDIPEEGMTGDERESLIQHILEMQKDTVEREA